MIRRSVIERAPSASRGRFCAAKGLRWAVLAGLLAVVVLTSSDTLQSSWSRLQDEPIGFTWHLGAAVTLFAAAVPLSGVLWGRILVELSGRPLSGIDAAAAHCISWMLKYVPGQVGSLVCKIVWGGRRGFAAPQVALSFLYENLFLLIASLLSAALLLPFAFGAKLSSNAVTVAMLIAVSIIGTLFVLGPGLRRLAPIVIRRLPDAGPEGALHALSARQSLEHATLFVLPRLLNAAGFVLIVCNLSTVGPADWLYLGTIYVLAGALGVLAIFVPSGLGVREAVIVLLASDIIGNSNAIIAAVMARLLSVVADGAVILIYAALRAVEASRAA